MQLEQIKKFLNGCDTVNLLYFKFLGFQLIHIQRKNLIVKCF